MRHFKYGGSTAERTLACPAWAALAAKLPEREVGNAARRGTAIHHLFEKCILDAKLEPLPGVYEGYELCEHDFASKLYPALDALDDLTVKYSLTDIQPEVEVKLAKDVGGTCDVMALATIDGPEGEGKKALVIADLKTGDGQMIYPEDNAQLMFYAACALASEPEFCEGTEFVLLAIIQPTIRREHALSYFLVRRAEVEKFGEDFLDAVAIADVYEATERSPTASYLGDHCTWCPALPTCPAQLARAADIASRRDFTPAALAEALNYVAEVEAWAKTVKAEAKRLAVDGGDIAGYKLVKGRGTRYWSDTDEASEFLRGVVSDSVFTECMNSELRTVPQVTTVLKKYGIDDAEISNYIMKSEPGLNLVPEQHSKEAYVVADNTLAGKIRRALTKTKT